MDEEAGGGTKRQHLERAARTGSPKVRARAAAELRAPDYPAELAYLHGWAMELHVARRFGQFGPEPVTYSDLYAWATLTDRHPEPYEVRALLLVTGVMAHPEPPKKAKGPADGGHRPARDSGRRHAARRG